MNIADLRDPADPQGRSYREIDNARVHAIPVGALVEIVHDPEDPSPMDGVRLFVVMHARDCDGEPLYELCADPEDTKQANPHLRNAGWYGGYGEESLTVIRNPGAEIPEAAVTCELNCAGLRDQFTRLECAVSQILANATEEQYAVCQKIIDEAGVYTPDAGSNVARYVTVARIVTDLLSNPYPHDLMAIRHEVNTSYGTDEEAERTARAEMDAYCTEAFMIEARRKWGEAQAAAREWLKTACATFSDHWPLNINPEMDKHAAEQGLGHWSCASPDSNRRWVRKDGKRFEAFTTGDPTLRYVQELKAFDAQHPVRGNYPPCASIKTP